MHASEDSKITSSSITENEERICKFLLDKVSRGIQYCIYFNKVNDFSSPSQNEWKGSQRIKWFRCCCKECPVQYQVRRILHKVCVYKLGNHIHPLRNQEGLNVDTKAALDPYFDQTDGAGIFLRKLREPDFPSDLRSVLLNGFDINNKISMSKFRRMCQNYLARKRMQGKKKKQTTPEIGFNQEDFHHWLMSKYKKLSDLNSPDMVPIDERNEIIILKHGIGDSVDQRTGQIIITSYEMLSQIKRCGLYFANHPQGVLAEIDYTHGLVNEDFCIGCVGVSDANRVFHPFLFEINLTENGDGAKSALLLFVQIIRRFTNVFVGRVLKDGGSALGSATRALRLRELSCLSHLIRKGWGITKGHGSGYLGSLPSYLRDKQCSRDEIKWLTLALLSLRYLPSETEYMHAIILFRSHCEMNTFDFCKCSSVKKHIFDYYFPLQARLNFSVMEPRSTNGLEKTFGVAKVRTKQIFQKLNYPTKTHSFFNYVTTFSSKNFTTRPKQFKKDWDQLRTKHVDEIPFEFTMATIYDATEKKLVDISDALTSGAYVAYIPTTNFLITALDEAREDFVSLAHNSFHTSMTIDLFRNCCTCNPTALSHLLSVLWKHLTRE